jgi:cell division protein FtsB
MTDETVKRRLSERLTRLVRRAWPLLWVGFVIGAAFLMTELAIDPRLEAKNTDLQREFARVGVQVVNLERRCEALRSENDRLKNDPREIMYHARNQLGMVRAGELIYQFTDEGDDPSGTYR